MPKIPDTYTTQSGDTWDIISYKLFGSEYLLHQLIQANPQHQYTNVFDSGTILTIPKFNIPQNKGLSPIYKK